MCFILISILLSLKSKQTIPKHPKRAGPLILFKMAVWPQLRASSTLNGKPSIPGKSCKVGFCVQGKPLLSYTLLYCPPSGKGVYFSIKQASNRPKPNASSQAVATGLLSTLYNITYPYNWQNAALPHMYDHFCYSL